MARVDTVISRTALTGATEQSMLEGKFDNADFGRLVKSEPYLSAQVAAYTKKLGAMSLLGVSDEWENASIATSVTFGSPAKPDAFEVTLQPDGHQIFGDINTKSWTLLPSVNNQPTLMVPTHEGLVSANATPLTTKTAEKWAEDGITPELVLALSGLWMQYQANDSETGFSSLSRVQAVRGNSTDLPLLTAGMMLRFSGQYNDMWLGEAESRTVLVDGARTLERFDPAMPEVIAAAGELFEWQDAA